MKKLLIVVSLVLVALLSYPLGWALFPWAQSLSAQEFTDGTKALLSPKAGTWIISLSIGVGSISLICAILVAIFYTDGSSSKNSS